MKILWMLTLLVSLMSHAQSDSLEFGRGHSGLGFDFGPCTGRGFSLGAAKNYIKPSCHVNIGLIFINHRIHYNFRLNALEGKLIDDLEFDKNWAKGNSFQSTNLDLALGYHLIDSRRINVIPFLSGGVKYFSSYHEPADKSTVVGGFLNYGLSLAVDYKIHFPVKEKNKYPGSEYMQQYFYVRVLGGFNPNYYSRHFNLNGGLCYVNLTIGGNVIPPRLKK